jgi:hypothetical protein
MKLGITAAVLGALTTIGLSAFAQTTEQTHTQCFFVNQFYSWKAPDARTIYVRIFPRRYYRLDLAGSCFVLRSPGAYLVTEFRGTGTVCSALDWDLHVAASNLDIPQPCIVKAMTELSAAEADAIPKRNKP